MRCRSELYVHIWNSLSLLSLGAFFLIATAVAGCRQEEIVTPPQESAFSGITVTDGSGNVLSNDPDDWNPILEAGVGMYPAYPNPCTSFGGFYLEFGLTARDSILITLNDTPSEVVDTIASGAFDPGNHQIHVNTGSRQGLYRVYFTVLTSDVMYTTHGDVQVDR
jgi:hypothetical protein